MSKIEVNTVAPQCGTTLTLGESGDTVTLGSGASQTGFGRTGTVDWNTTPKTATFTAVSGDGFFANTTGSAFNMNLPAGVAGAIVSVADYAGTWQTNNLTVVPNGTDKIGSLNENAILNVEGQSVTFIFVDSTQGWINTMDSTSNVRGAPPFIEATGGTILTCGNFKTHIFTSPGTLCVSRGGDAPNNVVDYLVIAGGGGGGFGDGGGGGAGGFRFANSYAAPGSNTPIVSPTGVAVSVQGYPITVGAGGAGGAVPNGLATQGANSIFSSITSTGGGRGSGYSPCNPASTQGAPGGSGSGSAGTATVGSGNTPPVSPPQGNNGGLGGPGSAGGGGGAGAVGSQSPTPPGTGIGGAGGLGTYIAEPFIGPTSPSYGTPGPVSSTRYFAGGAGGYGDNTFGPGPAAGGGGQGGRGGPALQGTAGTVNTGGGGGPGTPGLAGTTGGSGIVMIRYKFQ